MKILKSWLQNWIDLTEIKDKELLNLLESLGYEIESTKELKPNYKNIIVGEVLEIHKLPDATKIRSIVVDVGIQELNIICGAWNFNIGDKVAVAPPGSYIKDNYKIETREIMNVTSNGMICSPSELDLWNDNEGILVITDNVSNGELLENCYESIDLMIDISITPNRGDSMSHYGIAREISTSIGKKLKSPKKSYNHDIKNTLKVSHGNNSGARSYFALEIENIKVKNSSLDTMFKLSNVGVRPINNIVDATNYVLFDLGQPLHAFDRDKLHGPLSVRKSKEKEKIHTLDDQIRKLNKDDIVIIDNDIPVALGGVMGGFKTQVTKETTNVLIESANFLTVNILNTSRSLNLISEASMRFERGVDNFLQEMALVKYRECIKQLRGNYSFSEIIGTRDKKSTTKVIDFDPNYFEKIIGVEIESKAINKILKGLGFHYKINDNNTYTVTSPSWRYDIDREIDIVEELARHLNYDNFPSTISYGNNYSLGDSWLFINNISNILVSEGYYECSNLSFISKQNSEIFTPERPAISISNPLDESQKYLRNSSTTHLLNNLSNNINKGNNVKPLFEVGISFADRPNMIDKNIPEQVNYLSIVSAEKTTSNDKRCNETHYDIYHMKNLIKRICNNNVNFEYINRPGLHSRQSYTIISNGVNLGWFGKISEHTKNMFNIKLDTYIGELNLDKLATINYQKNTYKSISNYPFVKFDLSFELSDHVEAIEILEIINNIYPDYENSSYIFDEYFNPNDSTRTIGIRVKLRSHSETIKENDLNLIRSEIINKISSTFPAILKENE